MTKGKLLILILTGCSSRREAQQMPAENEARRGEWEHLLAPEHNRAPGTLRRMALYINLRHLPPRHPHQRATIRPYPLLCNDVNAYRASGYGDLLACRV